MSSSSEMRTCMFALIEEWENSGTTQKRFCEDKKIGLSRFQYWRKRYLSEHTEGPEGFAPLRFHKGDVPDHTLEVIYPNGVRLKVEGRIPTSHLRELVHLG